MYTPAQIAQRANVHPNTVRNYSRDYAEFLSPGARGDDGPRLFDDADLSVLCAVAALRKSGVSAADVPAHLRTISLVDTIQTPTLPAPQNAQEGQGEALSLQMVSNMLQSRLEALERRIEARERHSHLWTLGTGVWVGMVLMGALFFAVWLAVNGL